MKPDSFICNIAPRHMPRSLRLFRAPSRRAGDKPAPSILVVDDDLPARRAVQRALRARGWRVRAAASPEEALELVGRSVPDLVITELMNGTVTGWDLLCHEAMERPNLPILVMSSLPADALDGADLFARAYLQKPLDLKRLVAEVRRWLQEPAVICMS